MYHELIIACSSLFAFFCSVLLFYIFSPNLPLPLCLFIVFNLHPFLFPFPPSLSFLLSFLPYTLYIIFLPGSIFPLPVLSFSSFFPSSHFPPYSPFFPLFFPHFPPSILSSYFLISPLSSTSSFSSLFFPCVFYLLSLRNFSSPLPIPLTFSSPLLCPTADEVGRDCSQNPLTCIPLMLYNHP